MPLMKTEAIVRQMNSLTQRTQEMVHSLSTYPDCVDPLMLQSLIDTLRNKAADFFSEDRQLHLAVIGQLKAGKSSFLNELLFDGNTMLPFDNLPKTAIPTRIEYAPQNMLDVTYITHEDRMQLERLSVLDAGIPMVRAARDLIKSMSGLDYDLGAYLSMKQERIAADSLEELFHRLDDYVSENGRFTPIVKDVTLYVNLPAIQGITVVDTPGLNGPVASQSEKTRQYIETCDVAFFLSRAGSFLDDTDIHLLTDILPQKGIKNLVVVASQLDSALMDTIYDYTSLKTAYESTLSALVSHAQTVYAQQRDRMLTQGASSVLLNVIEGLREPVFVSAMARRMCRTEEADYTEYQRLIDRCLSMHGKIDNAWLKRIANFDKIDCLFTDILDRKDELMQSKASGFVLLVKTDIESRFSEIYDSLAAAQREDPTAKMTASRHEIVSVIHNAQKSIALAFDEYLSPLGSALQTAALEINALKDLHNQVTERQDVLIEKQAVKVSDTKLLLPWTWGSSHTEYHAEEVTVNFIDIGDQTLNLQHITDHVTALSHQVFDRFRDLSVLKNSLNKIASSLTSGGTVDATAIDRRTGNALQALAVPVCTYNCESFVQRIEKRFGGRITDLQRPAVTALYTSTVNEMLTEYYRILENRATVFSNAAESAKKRFCSSLFEDLYDKLHTLSSEIAVAQSHLNRLREASEMIDRFLS